MAICSPSAFSLFGAIDFIVIRNRIGAIRETATAWTSRKQFKRFLWNLLLGFRI
jgi:hypothetical protein